MFNYYQPTCDNFRKMFFEQTTWSVPLITLLLRFNYCCIYLKDFFYAETIIIRKENSRISFNWAITNRCWKFATLHINKTDLNEIECKYARFYDTRATQWTNLEKNIMMIWELWLMNPKQMTNFYHAYLKIE